ncbi:hypothetical protein J7443_09600 [Tropicibacter sp. R15_0]|uniref:DUF6900 domain-containing protein n=1 Tax=Tropicibacter sp. R15_0 TaxID=2821101 RepID=UPI001ADC78E2|nr:hypothetical protein [Tropicibacter sp. R15_0]MBO9465481.1 hypothetical protein [Tropicibacter sp. R15_0]
MEQLIAEIAEKHLRLETLEEQRSDRLDFKEHAVWNIKAALEAAYAAGAASTKLEAVTRQ